jgi:PhnB protein
MSYRLSFIEGFVSSVGAKFYEQALGGKIESMFTFAGTPMEAQVPPEWRNKVMHAQMVVSDQRLMGTDPPPGRYETPKGFAVTLQMNDPAEAERIFQALSEGGKITMPLQQTFWAARFGMTVDRFEIPWMINCGQAV